MPAGVDHDEPVVIDLEREGACGSRSSTCR